LSIEAVSTNLRLLCAIAVAPYSTRAVAVQRTLSPIELIYHVPFLFSWQELFCAGRGRRSGIALNAITPTPCLAFKQRVRIAGDPGEARTTTLELDGQCCRDCHLYCGLS
jgi:hypothetical protein